MEQLDAPDADSPNAPWHGQDNVLPVDIPIGPSFNCDAGIAANIALVVAGSYMKWVNAAFTQGSLLLSLRYLVATVIVLSGVMMGAKAYVDANIKSVDVSFQSSHLHPTPRRHKILLLFTCGGDVFWGTQ